MSRSWREAPWPLALFGIAAALILIFGRILEEVPEGDADVFDRNVIAWFRDPADPGRIAGPPWLQDAMRDITSLGSVSILVLILLIVFGYLMSARLYSGALFLFGAVAGGQLRWPI